METLFTKSLNSPVDRELEVQTFQAGVKVLELTSRNDKVLILDSKHNVHVIEFEETPPYKIKSNQVVSLS